MLLYVCMCVCVDVCMCICTAWCSETGSPPRFSAAGTYGPHEKSWKIGLGPLDLKSRPSPHCWVRRSSRKSTTLHFGPVEGGSLGHRTTTKTPSLNTNCNWLRPQGLKAFLPNFSTKFPKVRSSLGGFRRMTPRWKAWDPSKATVPFLFPVAKETNDSAVFKEVTHTFGSIFPNPYMQWTDQFVQGRDRGAPNVTDACNSGASSDVSEHISLHQVVCVRVCVCVCVRERRKIALTVWGQKVPIALDGIRTCTSGIRAHRAADYTTKVGPASRQSKRTL